MNIAERNAPVEKMFRDSMPKLPHPDRGRLPPEIAHGDEPGGYEGGT